MPTISDEELLARAYAATEHSYAAYSGFSVGAALLLDDGTVITGCNVENASYGLTNCAERTGVFRMVAERGPKQKILACAIVGAAAAPCYPCGACRQVLHEFGCQRVIVESERPTAGAPGKLGAPISIAFDDILPFAFGPEDLGAADASLTEHSS